MLAQGVFAEIRRNAVGLGFLLGLGAFACRSPADATKQPPPPAAQPAAKVQLPGVDTSELTDREVRQWSEYVSELLAPCADQPVSIAQCVTEKRSCNTCQPAAEFLVQRVRRGDTRSQAEGAFRSRFSPEAVRSIEIGSSPTRGATSASVTIVEWADFECPFCGLVVPFLDKVAEKYPNDVKMVFKNYPLSSHEHSDKAARAAVAAGKQGKFWEFEHLLFASQKTGMDETNLLKMARSLNLEIKAFDADRASEETADSVAADRKQADALGLKGTPMIYINGRLFELANFDIREDLEPWIQLEIALKTGATAQAKPAAARAPSAGMPAAATAEGKH